VTQTHRPGLGWPWLAAVLAVPVFGVVAAFATVQPYPEPLLTRAVVEPLALSGSLPAETGPAAYFHEERFQRGDTVSALLTRLGADPDDARALLRSSGAAKLSRLVRPGTTVQASTRDGKLQSLSFLSGTDSLVTVDR